LPRTDCCPATVSWPRLAQRGALESLYKYLSGAITCAAAALPQREQCDGTYNFKILREASSKSMKSDSQVATDRSLVRNRFLAEAYSTRFSGIISLVSFRRNDLCRCSTSTARAMRWNIQFQNPACCVFKIREISQPSCHGQIAVPQPFLGRVLRNVVLWNHLICISPGQ